MSLHGINTDRRAEVEKFLDDVLAVLKSGSALTDTEWDDRLARAAELVASPGGVARGVVVDWLSRSIRADGVSTLDTTFDAASVLEPAGIDVGTIRELVGFLLTIWELLRSRGVR